MNKNIRLCDMCGKKPPGPPQPESRPAEGDPPPPPPPHMENWIIVEKMNQIEGDLIQPGRFDLCSEACLQRLVAGETPVDLATL